MWFMSSGWLVSLNWQRLFCFCKNIRKYLSVICDKNRFSHIFQPTAFGLPLAAPTPTFLWLVGFLLCVTSGKQSRVVIGWKICPVRSLKNEYRSELGAVRSGMPCLRWGRQRGCSPALLVSQFSFCLTLNGLKLNTETRMGPIISLKTSGRRRAASILWQRSCTVVGAS